MERRRIKRGQGRSMAYAELKDKIQYLELMPGSVIQETELTEEMDMSRTPIREALIRLSEEFLVDIYPQRGTYVAQINFELAREVAYMRHLLDTDVCMKLCREKAQIRDSLDEQIYFMRTAVKKGGVADYIRQDNRFHGKIFDIAGHSMIWNVISNSRAHYNRVLMLDLQRDSMLERSFDEHCKIIEYIESGDEASLTAILDTHHDHNMDTAHEQVIKDLYPAYFPK